MNEQEIKDLLTPQEAWAGKLSPDAESFEGNNWHTPQAVLKGLMSIKEVAQLRKLARHFETGALHDDLGIKDKRPITVGFSAIDEITGMTLEDPKILGLWDERKGAIIQVKGRDLTQEAYEIHKKLGVDLRLRETKIAGEGSTNPSEQKG